MKKALTHRPVVQPGLTQRVRLAGGLAVIGLIAGLGLLASRPARTAGGPIPVTVANTPLAVTTMPGEPVEVLVSIASSSSPSFQNHLYTVPAHKSLVVESMSLLGGGGRAGSYTGIVYLQDSAGHTVTFVTLATPASTNSDVATTTQPMHFTVAPGGMVSADVYLRDPSGVYGYISLSGYLVDAP